jgi:hypothetical protein
MPRKTRHPRAGELEDLARIVETIEANQADYPGYCAGILDAIVSGELHRLEAEQARMEDSEPECPSAPGGDRRI